MEEVEKGRLDLSAPISRYLDDIPQSWGRVTVAQLMGQVSGLPDVFAYDDYELTGITDEAKAWAWVVKQPVSPPGEKREYCQTNLALVQRILNRLNGRAPTDSVIGEELARAGMMQTRFGDSRDVMKEKSQPYRRLNAEGELRNHFEQFPPTMHGNSGLNSTADDMARWMISVLDGRQLSEKSLQTLWAPVLMNDGRPSSFSIGWGPEQRANYSSVGMSGGARSAFSIYPRYRVGVVILTNLLGAAPEELTDEVAAAFAPELRLSGIYKLRAEAEQASFANLDALLAAAQAQRTSDEFRQGELEDWISRLSYGGSLSRSLRLAKFDVALFPGSSRALEVLAKAYQASGLRDEARVTYGQLLTRDPKNKAARAYLGKT
jgi:CubicO group peptidase (beta-lactamase class C family)